MAPELRNKTYIMQKLQGNNYKAERVNIVVAVRFNESFQFKYTAKRTTRERRARGQRNRIVEEHLVGG